MMSEVVELDELKIPLEDIRSATNNFAKENFIGGGGFGSVYRGKLQRSNGYLAVAVKRLDPDNGQGEHEFRNEIELLSCYKHENVVSLIGFCEEDGEMILVYEYAVHESLYKQLKDGSTRLTWEQRLTICIGVAHGLEYLHTRVGSQHRVIHRDIKSSNILLDKNWEAKIADFGLSKIGPANQGNSVVMSNLAGTAGYCDPEYVDFGILSKESDVYSFGVVLFEVLSGNVGKMSLAKWAKRCYKDDRLDNVTDNSLSDHIKPESLRIFADVAFLCLKSRREERPTIGRVVEALENALKTQLGVKTDNICFWWAPALRMYLKKLHIPDYILMPDLEPEATESTDGPSCPVLVFINSKCGGHLGVNLLATYRSLTLIKDQIFDLEQESPDVVLRRLYLNLERLKVHGDKFALVVQERLRIIVAGDDETTNWLVGVVSDLRLSRPPPIAAVPLGIENNLSFAFGWGKKNPGTDRASVFSFLDQVWTAKEMAIDSWHILMRMRVPTTSSHDPIAPLELPRSLHGFHRISSTDELNMDGYDTFRGGFWNYFSIGMDAELSYTFHSEQKLHPEKYKNQLPGQGRRAKLKSFIASRFLPSSRNIAQLTKVKIMGGSRQWMDLNLPHSIRTIVCLNLPSFAGGLNPWGTPSQNLSRDRDLTPPYVDDGLLEIVGFKDAGNGLGFLASKGYGIRFAQACRIRFEFHKSAAEYTYMRIDGEAWKQPLPTDDDSVVIEISHGGQVKMLASENCRSKSINDPLSPLADYTDGEDSDDEEDDPSIEEVRRKFGAAESFKVPHEVDISHLS